MSKALRVEVCVMDCGRLLYILVHKWMGLCVKKEWLWLGIRRSFLPLVWCVWVDEFRGKSSGWERTRVLAICIREQVRVRILCSMKWGLQVLRLEMPEMIRIACFWTLKMRLDCGEEPQNRSPYERWEWRWAW